MEFSGITEAFGAARSRIAKAARNCDRSEEQITEQVKQQQNIELKLALLMAIVFLVKIEFKRHRSDGQLEN